MLGWIHEKMATQGFLPLIQPPLEMAPQPAVVHALQVGTAQRPLGMVPGTMHIHSTCPTGVRGWSKN
jgi:hypothetical protein